jgi:glutamate dehydrogenase (NAD(P)+)
VQGFGNVGSWAARILQDLGATMVGVSDAGGAIQSEAGIDAHALQDFLAHGGRLREFPGPDKLSPQELLSLECDLFVPAALGGMIHRGNADLLNCRVIVEGANSPTTPAGDEILTAKGVTIVPDLLANAGGVVVSYFEWVQNLQHFRWDETEVNQKLERVMKRAYAEVSARAEADGESLRVGAFTLGIERVLDAARTRGYIG